MHRQLQTEEAGLASAAGATATATSTAVFALLSAPFASGEVGGTTTAGGVVAVVEYVLSIFKNIRFYSSSQPTIGGLG